MVIQDATCAMTSYTVWRESRGLDGERSRRATTPARLSPQRPQAAGARPCEAAGAAGGGGSRHKTPVPAMAQSPPAAWTGREAYPLDTGQQSWRADPSLFGSPPTPFEPRAARSKATPAPSRLSATAGKRPAAPVHQPQQQQRAPPLESYTFYETSAVTSTHWRWARTAGTSRH